MVDLRPLLFINALVLMLLVTAGFAHRQDINIPALADTLSPATERRAGDIKTTDYGTPIGSADLSAQLESFRSTENAPGESLEEAVLFVDQLTPEQQQALEESNTTQDAENSALLASADADQTLSLPQQIVAKETQQSPSPTMSETGKLFIRSNVANDNVLINGKPYGASAVEVELPAGEYEIEVSKEGYKTFRNKIDLTRGDSRTISVTLDRITVVEYKDGVWKHGVVTGEGTYVGKDGSRYQGEFVNKLFHGKGLLKMANGAEYNGEWYEGRKHGHGSFKQPNGDLYVGDFRDDQFNGEGTLTLKSGDIYTGYWVDGKLNGEGTLTGKNGMLFVGGFSESKYHGSGSLTYPDGTHYEGGFANGQFQGKGELIYADGKKYTGQFFEGKFHGQGELLNPNGSKISGTFKFGKPYGLATLTTPEGEIFTARSSNPGVCYRLKSYRATQCPPLEGW
ncbi:PEGA domain-containing protein [Hahella sp. HN01]|uniref:PEGA domain-containing protein n=1 Tax=Hahella sp. HN01 TaxID=2847262 RepID=UPI001C1ECAD6|nr:PEGA domain-containing protein [Hahella sp. HN01]MBU6955726.1 PEGA domain-containing protein [Hahella sp. HN01]